MAVPQPLVLETLKPRLERAFATAQIKVRNLVEASPDFFPMYTSQGRWNHGGALWTDWCAGFLAGQMWLIAERTGDRWWRSTAEHYSRLLEYKQHDREVHDLGFIFLNTYLPWYQQTADPHLHQVLITAGQTLAIRFQPKGQYLCSFIGTQSLFIDIMMNVPIIYYAARETNDPALRAIADAHCRTTERFLVRPNGGTAHEGTFNPETGQFLHQSTHQGLNAESDWTRGLAWSLYGYGTVYTYTQNLSDLDVACRNADHFLNRLPDSFIPPWDFDAPAGALRIADSSAGAIAASGLLQLAQLTASASPDRSQQYQLAAWNLLDALCLDQFLACANPDWEGTLKHGVYHYHRGLGVDESVMWGDFFFLEAVCKVLATIRNGQPQNAACDPRNDQS